MVVAERRRVVRIPTVVSVAAPRAQESAAAAPAGRCGTAHLEVLRERERHQHVGDFARHARVVQPEQRTSVEVERRAGLCEHGFEHRGLDRVPGFDDRVDRQVGPGRHDRRGPRLHEQIGREGRAGGAQCGDVAGAAVAPDGHRGAFSGLHQLQVQPVPVVEDEPDPGQPPGVVPAARQRGPREQTQAVVRPRDAPSAAAFGLVHGVLQSVGRQGLHEHRLVVGQRRDDDVGGGGRRHGRRHAHQHAICEGREVVGRFRQGGGLFDELPAADPRQPARIYRRGEPRRSVSRRLRVGIARPSYCEDGDDGQRREPRRPRSPRAGCLGRTGPVAISDGHVSPRRVERRGFRRESVARSGGLPGVL